MTMNQNMLPSGVSPVNVVDISAVLQMELLIDENLDKLRAPSPSQMMMTAMNRPPPLDTVTTTTSTDETDSVTSLSTGSPDHEEDIDGSTRSLPTSLSSSVPKRSIFSSYWDKTGEKPVKPQSPNRALLYQRSQRVVATCDGIAEHKSYSSQDSSAEDAGDSYLCGR